jgi:hypothetical protein
MIATLHRECSWAHPNCQFADITREPQPHIRASAK